MRTIGISLLLCMPMYVEAQVLISEIAWMGTETSANDEWIELHNNGETVALDGWTISDGVNLHITLAGTAGAGQYVVLERTDDDSAPGTAFLMYTGALANTGSTLTLRNASGSVVDTVVGGEDWSLIGGDNATKDTPQRRNGTWVTAVPTPGNGNLSAVATAETDENTSASGIQTSSGSSGAVVKKTPATKSLLYIDPRIPKGSIEAFAEGLVNQPVTFAAAATGVSRSIINSMEYTWNFGDLTTATGKDVQHTYQAPGRYQVVVEGSYGDYTMVAVHEIEIKAVTLQLVRKGDTIELTNTAPYTIEVSGYTLRTEGGSLRLPPHSYILAGETVTIPRKTLSGATVLLFDGEGQLVASSDAAPKTSALPTSNTAVRSPAAASQAVPAPTSDPQPVDVVVATATTALLRAPLPLPQTVAAQTNTATAPQAPNANWPYIALIGVIALGIGSLIFSVKNDEKNIVTE